MDTRINEMDTPVTEREYVPERTSPRSVWWLVGMLTLMLCNLGVTTWLLTRPAPQPAIVAFDMKGTLDQFLTQSASQSLTEAQSMQLAERFSAALDASLNDYQRAHQALILVSPSVVRGAPDITLTIQRDIAARMREGTQ